MATGNIDQQEPVSAFDDLNYDDDNSAMSLIEHLEELRWRIFKSLIAITVGAIIAFIFRNLIISILQMPLPAEANAVTRNGHPLIVNGLMEGFTVYLMISIAVGVVLALPVILYQTWAFIAPGLYEKERKYAVPFIFVGVILFVAGVALAYFVLRYPVQWFVDFSATSFTELITANSYFTFVAFFILAFGIVFELPLVLTFLAQVDLLSSRTLRKKRTVAHVSMWVAATFLTPGADPYSPVILGVAMSFLYELTIIFIRITKK